MPNTRGIRAGKAFIELGTDNNQLSKGLRRAQKRLKAFGASVTALGAKVTAVGAGVLTPLLASTRVFASVGDNVQKMALRTGLSTEALSELGFAAEQSGSDLSTLEKGIKTMQRSINDAGRGLSTANDALTDLGLTFAQLSGLSPEEQFKLIADRVSGIDDPTKKAAVAMQLFGRAGQQLIPLLDLGAKGMEDLQSQARDLGLTISQVDADAAAELTDSMNMFKRAARAGAFAVGSALAPALNKMIKTMTRLVVSVSTWVKENKAVVVSVAKIAAIVTGIGIAIAGLGAVIIGVGAVFGGLATIITGAVAAIGFIGSAIAAIASPIGLVIAGVVALGAAVFTYSGIGGQAIQWLLDRFQSLRQGVGEVLEGIANALAAGDISLAARILWLGLKVAWKTGIAEVEKVLYGFKNSILTVLHGAYSGALAASQELWHAIEVGWLDLKNFVARTWRELNETAEINRAERVAKAQKRRVQASSASPEEKARLERDIDNAMYDRIAEISKKTNSERKRSDAKYKRERSNLQELNDLTLAEIGRGYDDAIDKINKKASDSISETEREIADAQKELDDALIQAKKQREETDGGGGGSSPIPNVSDLVSQLTGGIETAVEKVSVSGTFSSRAASGLAASAEDRTAKAVEQSNRYLRRIDQSIRQPANGTGLAFT